MRRRLIVIPLVVVALLVAGGAVFWYTVIRSDSPPPVALSTNDSTATTTAGASTATLPGAWVIAPNGKSLVGYRVKETFAGVPSPTDAVGRTTAVTGTMQIAGTSVSSVDVKADVTQLKSDKDRRDAAIRGRGLETEKFPEATFRLTGPVDLGTPKVGAQVKSSASGDLTLHGVTKAVTVPITGRWTGDTVEVVGSLPVQFTDFQIEAPSIAGFVSVQDHGTMELKLFFTRQ